MLRPTVLAVLALASLGCSSSESVAPADVGAPSCVAGKTASGTVFALGGECLTLTSVRARAGGTWSDVPEGRVTLTRLDDTTVTLSASAAEAEAFELTLVGARGGSLLQQGYQSWGFSGAVLVPESVPRDAEGALLAMAARTGSPLDEATGVSYGAALLGDPNGPALAIASTSSAVASTAIGATRDRASGSTTVTILYGAALESLPIDADQVTRMPAIAFAARPDANAALDAIAARMKEGLGTEARTPKKPPGGWFSWNELFDEVDEPSVRANLAVVAERLLPLGLPLVEIDDGWEGLWGDWTANAKFPSGMDGIGQAIRDAGLTPGVWLAPFLVDTESVAAKTADASLFVQGDDGKPLRHEPSGNPRHYYVLDGTNPAAMELAAKPIRALEAAGYRFFKLDFLYAGALPGRRKAAGATGTMALRQGLEALRAAMGDDAMFNACGAPIAPVLGLADSLRVGTDTAFAPVSLAWSEVAFAARSLAARSFLAPMVFVDADQAQLRAPYTLGEAKASAAVSAMAGPAYALGDDLTKLPAERLAIALAPELVDLAGAASPARPDQPLENAVAELVVAPLVDTISSHGGTGAPPPTRFTATGRSGAVVHLTFDWLDTRAVTIRP